MPPQKSKAKKGQMPAKKVTQKAKAKAPPVQEESSDIDEEEEDIDDSDVEQMQLPKGMKQKLLMMAGSDDDEEDDDEDDDDSDLDEDLDDEEIDMDDDDEEEIEEAIKKAKIPASNGKEKTTGAKKAAQEESKKAKKEAKDHESREHAVGPVTDEEKELFSKGFRAMSATSVFVAKLPEDTTNEDLKKLHPSVHSIRRPTTRKGKPATFGFLNFPNKETADRALKDLTKKGAALKIRGKEIAVNSNGSGQCHPPTFVDRRKLKIYGCPKHITKESIKVALPGCVDVLLGERDRGNNVEAVVVFKTSADAKKVVESKPTVTLNDHVCALFYLNIAHSVKQNERKKDRKAALKKIKKTEAEQLKSNKENEDAEADSDDDVEEEVKTPAAKKGKKTPVKAETTPKGKKRPAPESDDDDEEEDQEDEVVVQKPSNKKVSMKSPAKTTPANKARRASSDKKTPRKGTPFQKRVKA